MPKRLNARLLAVVLILAVCALGLHTAAHWHSPSDSGDQICQTCHIGHAAIPQPAMEPSALAPTPIARFAPLESLPVGHQLVFAHQVPRGPPA